MKSRACYIVWVVMCISVCAQAQYTSRLGRFQVDEKKGCNDLVVNITSAQCASGDCNMIFGDGPPGDRGQGNVFQHTYTKPGTYKLQVLFQGGTQFDDIDIVVTADTLSPQFEVYTCSGNQVSVNIKDSNYEQYVINYNDGTPDVVRPKGNLAKDQHLYTAGPHTVTVRGRNIDARDNCPAAQQNVIAVPSLSAPTVAQLQVVDNASIQLNYNAAPNIPYRLEIAGNNAASFQAFKTSYNLTTETLTNLKADDNYYCFRLGTVDACNNAVPPQYSNIICSANFDLSVVNNANNSLWITSTAGVSNFRISRTIQGGNAFATNVNSSPYSDTDIVCGTEYCYQLTTNYPNGSRSISLQKCGTAISTDIPAPVENITAVVGQDAVDLQWQHSSGAAPEAYSVFRSTGNAYDLLTTTTGLQARDETYRTENETCYKISYKDVCGNESPLTAEACPVRLSGSLQRDNAISLSWSPYTGWSGGVASYVVEKYNEQGQLLQTFAVGNILSFTDDAQDLSNQLFVYVVKVNATEPGLPQAVSNRVVIIKNPNLFHPTSFTPNGDALNDIFNVYGQYIVAFEMNIFNRWGELMYTTTEIERGWDGTFKGNPMPEGTYAFVAQITDQAGRSFKKSGSVLLLRKK